MIITPDFHTFFQFVDQILEKEKGNYDLHISLGDEFDNWYDTPRQNMEAAEWLKAKLYDKKTICILGNHTTSYISPNTCRCSGYTPQKEKAIKKILKMADFKRMRFFHHENGFLFSHAGFNNKLLPVGAEPLKFLKEQEPEARKALFGGKSHWFFEAGRARGGYRPYGGLLWDDFSREFEPITGLKQIFGHSPIFSPAKTENGDYCIDTWAAKVYTYLMIDKEGNVEIKFL